jgi:hypothetical protein
MPCWGHKCWHLQGESNESSRRGLDACLPGSQCASALALKNFQFQCLASWQLCACVFISLHHRFCSSFVLPSLQNPNLVHLYPLLCSNRHCIPLHTTDCHGRTRVAIPSNRTSRNFRLILPCGDLHPVPLPTEPLPASCWGGSQTLATSSTCQIYARGREEHTLNPLLPLCPDIYSRIHT